MCALRAEGVGGRCRALICLRATNIELWRTIFRLGVASKKSKISVDISGVVYRHHLWLRPGLGCLPHYWEQFMYLSQVISMNPARLVNERIRIEILWVCDNFSKNMTWDITWVVTWLSQDRPRDLGASSGPREDLGRAYLGPIRPRGLLGTSDGPPRDIWCRYSYIFPLTLTM